MNEIRIDEVLNKIHTEILNRLGNGFTVEISAEVAKYLEWTEPWSSYSTAKKRRFDMKYINSFEVDGHYHGVDLDIAISEKIEKELPSGITIHKSPLAVLIEQPDQNKSSLGNPVYLVEGYRVFLTVSDEYATQILLKQYRGECLFCQRLLTKYENILLEIAAYFVNSSTRIDSHRIDFRVDSRSVSIVWNAGGGMNDGKTFSFEDWEMRPLRSAVEQYGMALALVATIRKTYPEWKNVDFLFRHWDNRVVILFKAPPQQKAKTTKVLKNW